MTHDPLPGPAATTEGLVWLRSKENGRLEREVLGPTRYQNVPPSPYYSPKPGWWASTRAWLDSDGRHVWVAHDCAGVRESHMLPWPVWQALPDGRVDPSYSCSKCGVHTFPMIGWELVDLTADLAERRADKGFVERIRDRVKRDKPLLDRLAEGPTDE